MVELEFLYRTGYTPKTYSILFRWIEPQRVMRFIIERISKYLFRGWHLIQRLSTSGRRRSIGEFIVCYCVDGNGLEFWKVKIGADRAFVERVKRMRFSNKAQINHSIIPSHFSDFSGVSQIQWKFILTLCTVWTFRMPCVCIVCIFILRFLDC